MKSIELASSSAACRTLLAACVVYLVFAGQQAHAVPAAYIYDGTGSGLLGNSSFSNTHFTITGLADTSNIGVFTVGGGGPQSTHLSTTINLAGLGLFSITTPSHTWMDLSPSGLGGIGRNLDVNWITLHENALIGYGLATPIGPVLETAPQDVIQFTGVSTSGGLLSFGSITSVTFTAVITPEPASCVLAAVGAIVFVCRRKR